MPYTAILLKEWYKLRWVLLILSVGVVAVCAWFLFQLTFEFRSIEPEAMMWYRFAQLGDKPYAFLAPLFALLGIIIAFAQFLPEAIRNRVRILTHLPLPVSRMVLLHLFIGGVAVVAVGLFFSVLLVMNMAHFYPRPIVFIVAKDCLVWTFSALVFYLGFSSCVIERNLWLRGLKLFIPLAVGIIFWKARYSWHELLLVPVGLWLILLVLDSFHSVKNQRQSGLLYHFGGLAVALIIVVGGGIRYQQEFTTVFNHYYLFYSPVLDDFVYQQNGHGHQFVYGTATQTFDRNVYENALPFVYWKNLDIQGRLPVEVKGRSYDKQSIRQERLSLQYSPDRLIRPEVAMYPLFNPHSNKGSIPFPEKVFAVNSNSMTVYDSETAQPDEALTVEVNLALDTAGLQFPVTQVWGKTTNMKPYDWGYFILDHNNQLVNLRRYDNQVTAIKINLPADFASLAYIQISENRQQKFYGYAVTTDSKVYLISYPDYSFIELPLADFNYQNMKFQLLSDPLFYVVRYDDGEQYHAVLLDKNYHFQKETVFQ